MEHSAVIASASASWRDREMRYFGVTIACVILAWTIVPVAAGAPRLETAIADPSASAGSEGVTAFTRVRDAGATKVRLALTWRSIAPVTRPADFDAENPADPRYRWEEFDRQVLHALERNLEPVVTVLGPPQWGQDSRDNARGWPSWRVDAAEFAKFARAAAVRYSGTFAALPRVRYWEAWNEPNLSLCLNPQYAFSSSDQMTIDANMVLSDDLYREIVNAFARAVHAVHRDNVVIAGAMGPFTGQRPEIGPMGLSVGPLRFMREMLCMSRELKPTCETRVEFDAWSTHPYTSRAPTRHAYRPDDVSLGDLPEMRRLLRAAVRAGHVASNRNVEFWITEFSYDSKPPDAWGVPLRLHARWVSHALYQAWRSGVSLVTWWLLRDEPSGVHPDGAVAQSGLYFRGATLAEDRPKPALQAFRFPFVAFKAPRGIRTWGRTPWGIRGRVIV